MDESHREEVLFEQVLAGWYYFDNEWWKYVQERCSMDKE